MMCRTSGVGRNVHTMGRPKPTGCRSARRWLRLARSLGLDLVVEGVETDGQLRTLRALGCRFVQGFLFARPMEIGALRKWLEAGGVAAGREAA